MLYYSSGHRLEKICGINIICGFVCMGLLILQLLIVFKEPNVNIQS